MMERKEAINYLLYMKHDVLANSPYDVAIDTAIEALKETAKKPKTNGDRIRQMTDEELARFLEITCGCSVCFLDATAGECPGFRSSMDCIVNKMKWLRKEVSEDAGTD